MPWKTTLFADWSSLPLELVCVISNRLSTLEDYTALTLVCRSFRFATAGESRSTIDDVSQPPWLLLSFLDYNSPAAGRGLLSMYRHRKRFLMNLPELHGRHCWGSPYGWILTLGLDRQLHLFNPLNRRRIALPEQIHHEYQCKDEDKKLILVRKYCFKRAILIKTPPSSSSFSAFDDFTVATVACVDEGGEFRVMRPDGWVKVEFLGPLADVVDVICYKGQIYAVSNGGMLHICSNFDCLDPPTASELVPAYSDLFYGFDSKFYLVESLGQLLWVVRLVDCPHDDPYFTPTYNTYGFHVYKLDFQNKEWIGINNLGDCALFVGDCESISLPQPEVYNCKKNCIYFTDNNYKGRYYDLAGHDMGIYDVEKDDSEPFYVGDDSFSEYSTPTWFVPSFT